MYKILFVDDDKDTLEIIKRKIFKKDSKLFFATSAYEAIDILEKENISVIVTDLRMSEFNGITLLELVKNRYPNIIRIAMSYMKDINTISVLIRKGQVFRCIQKPIMFEDEFLPSLEASCEKFSNINLNEEFLHKLKDLNLDLRKENENFSEELSKSKAYIHTMNDFLIKYIGETLNLTSHIKTYLDKPDEEIISKLFAEIHHLESFSQSIITSLKNGEKHDK